MYEQYVLTKKFEMLLYNDTLTHYLQTVFNRIVTRAGIDFKKPIRLLVVRSDVPNAFSASSEIFFFNIGLIANLNSESQLAFVISHEISHELKDHVFKNILSHHDLRNSEAYKKGLKNSKRSRYDSYNAMRNFDYAMRAKEVVNNKQYELQADSLALILLEKAGYQKAGAYNALNLLDSMDYGCLKDTIEYESVFKSKSTKFNNQWLIDNETFDLSTNLNHTIPDSLKTHPDCKIRIGLLHLDHIQETTDRSDFEYFKAIAKFGEIDLLMARMDIDKALYQTIQLLKVYPNNAYLKTSYYYCLAELYAAKKNHYLSEVISTVTNYFPENYNQFLIFLNQLPSSVIKEYLNEFVEGPDKNKSDYAQFVSYYIKSLDLSLKEKQKLSEDFDLLNISDTFKKELKNKLQLNTNKHE